MIFRQLPGVPESQFVPQRGLRDLVFRQRLNDLVVDQQAVDKQDFLAGRVRRLKYDRAPLLAVLHAGENRGFNQFRFMFQFFMAVSVIHGREGCLYAPSFLASSRFG